MNKKIVHELLDYLKMIIFALAFVFIINHFVIVNASIPSESMENTIMTKDRLFGNRLAYLFKEPQRGDIVIFKFPDDERKLYIKRVIGLPGDKVSIVGGKVYINDNTTPLEEPYLPEPMQGDYGPYNVPEGEYFMLGDNRNHSGDSRRWVNTFVTKKQIEGEAAFRYFPFSQMGAIN